MAAADTTKHRISRPDAAFRPGVLMAHLLCVLSLALHLGAEQPGAITYVAGPPGSVVGFAGDGQGNVYVVGSPNSNFSPTPRAPYPALTSATGSYLAKFDPQGAPVFATYLPGLVSALAVDQGGNAIVVTGAGFDVPPQQFSLVTVDATGTKATVAQALTCTGCWNFLTNIALDGSGSVYLAGYDPGTVAATPGAFQTQNRGASAFILKYNLSVGKIVYATYLGGSGQERYLALAADAAGDAYVVGSTTSLDFPVTPSAYETKTPSTPYPGFATKLSPDGSTLVYSTYLDTGAGIVALDSAGDLFLSAAGALFALSPDGRKVVSSISLDVPGYVTSDPSGNLVVTSGTFSTSFAGVNPLQLPGTAAYPFQDTTCYFGEGRYSACTHAVLATLDPQGKVIWSSLLGGDGFPAGHSGVNTYVAGASVDSSGNIYAAIGGVGLADGFDLIKVEPVSRRPCSSAQAWSAARGLRPASRLVAWYQFWDRVDHSPGHRAGFLVPASDHVGRNLGFNEWAAGADSGCRRCERAGTGERASSSRWLLLLLRLHRAAGPRDGLCVRRGGAKYLA